MVQGGRWPGFSWGGQTFWHAEASDSRGVAVLFRAGVPVEDVVVGHQDGAGRVLRVDFSFGEMALSVISVYAPCVPGSEQNAFFTTTLMAALPPPSNGLAPQKGRRARPPAAWSPGKLAPSPPPP